MVFVCTTQVSYNNGYAALAATMSSKTPQKNGGGGGATKTKKTPNGKFNS